LYVTGIKYISEAVIPSNINITQWLSYANASGPQKLTTYEMI